MSALAKVTQALAEGGVAMRTAAAESLQANPGDPDVERRAEVMDGIGFAFLTVADRLMEDALKEALAGVLQGLQEAQEAPEGSE